VEQHLGPDASSQLPRLWYAADRAVVGKPTKGEIYVKGN
jgi:hypothetical protein